MQIEKRGKGTVKGRRGGEKAFLEERDGKFTQMKRKKSVIRRRKQRRVHPYK